MALQLDDLLDDLLDTREGGGGREARRACGHSEPAGGGAPSLAGALAAAASVTAVARGTSAAPVGCARIPADSASRGRRDWRDPASYLDDGAGPTPPALSVAARRRALERAAAREAESRSDDDRPRGVRAPTAAAAARRLPATTPSLTPRTPRVGASATRRPVRREQGSPALRATRRGRLVALLSLLGVLLIGSWVSLGYTTASAGSSAVHTTTVRPGETLWGVAQRVSPHADPRDVVDQLMARNGLSSSTIFAGETLQVP